MRDVFGASYRIVTLVPVVFGAGKWVASLPTGYLVDRIERRTLMMMGVAMIAMCDIASLRVVDYRMFLGVRGVAGAGWAMFATVATTTVIQRGEGRGRAISMLLLSETFGLLLGSTAGGWLYEGAGKGSPFLIEAGCMTTAATVAWWFSVPPTARPRNVAAGPDARSTVGHVLGAPDFILAAVVNAIVMGTQTGVLVFLLPLYLLERGGLAPHTVGLLVGLGALGRLLALWLGGGISDRHDRLRLLAIGLAVFSIALGTLVMVRNPWLLGVWTVLIGGAGGLIAGLPTAIVGDRVDRAYHGAAVGMLRTITDTGMVLGPLVMGPVADACGLEAPFLMAAMAIGGLAWMCRHPSTLAR
jgi:predicted MFS family arabinose efflux permease